LGGTRARQGRNDQYLVNPDVAGVIQIVGLLNEAILPHIAVKHAGNFSQVVATLNGVGLLPSRSRAPAIGGQVVGHQLFQRLPFSLRPA
jgi:hypothetical protein